MGLSSDSKGRSLQFAIVIHCANILLQVADFVPDIQVQSKRKKKFRTLWKDMRLFIDTGCLSGNWVTLQAVRDLGFKGKLLPLTVEEQRGSQCATGAEFRARGAVMLTWHGVPEGGLPNYGKNFTMRFQVSSVENCPYEILIGSHSICKEGIMYAPCLMSRKHTLLPQEDKAKAEAKATPQGT
jgi:hypothetical protein